MGGAALRARDGRRRCRRRQVAARRGGRWLSIEATVVRGRCLPYGEGITYWPVVEVLKQLDAAASGRGRRGGDPLAARRDGGGDAPRRRSPGPFRKTLEHAAAERPLVVVFDDIQWGEETFLDLVEHVALLSSGASILLLCMARPELVERRPTWPVTLRLEPLGDDDVDELIPERIAGELRERIARAAGGNPLFIEEMLAMAGDDGRRRGRPAHAAGAARGAPRPARDGRASVLERGAIEGEIFHRGAVQALAPAGDPGDAAPRRLVRKELIGPGPAAACRRRRVPLPPPPDPRRSLRRAPEGDACRPPRALRILAGGARHRPCRAGRDSRLPPRAGLPLPR